MNANMLVAVMFIGIIVLCLALIAALTIVVRALIMANSGGETEPRPRRKVLIRPPGSSSTPSLVKPPTERSESDVEPLAGPDGITSIDKTGATGYRELHELPPALAMEAVENYLRGEGEGKAAMGAALDNLEGEE